MTHSGTNSSGFSFRINISNQNKIWRNVATTEAPKIIGGLHSRDQNIVTVATPPYWCTSSVNKPEKGRYKSSVEDAKEIVLKSLIMIKSYAYFSPAEIVSSGFELFFLQWDPCA